MKTNSTINNMRGFTLVELMVVVLLTAIAVIAIYRGYTAFSSSADAQEQTIEMQQNLRIGMYMIEKDIRRAGMNEEDDENAGFTVAAADTVEFTMDLGGTDPAINDETWFPDDPGDGGLTDDDERLTYSLIDIDGDGRGELVRTDENNGDPDAPINMNIITNVDALNFVYLAEDGSDTLDPDTTLNDPATGRLGVAAGDLGDIYSVEIAIVVRTTNEDLRYTNNEQYRNAQGSLIYQAPGDHFRRRLSVKQIKIRNAGL